MTVEITFKTLTGGSFKLPADEAETVLDMKRKIAKEQSNENFKGYRLIFKGKVLSDDATITSAGISSTGFVVVMPPKKIAGKPAKPVIPAKKEEPPKIEKPAERTAAASTDKPSAPAAPTAPVAPVAPAAPAANTPSAPVSSPSAESSLLTGAEFDQSVQRICEMGFPEEQVKKAMRAAYNNPDRAVEFLFNGIPDTPAEPATPAAPTSAPRSTTPAGTTTPPTNTQSATPPANTQSTTRASSTPFNMFEAPSGGDGVGIPEMAEQTPGSLDFLRTIPQFNLMRRLIQSNPAVLPQILQQLESINPSLMAMIDANQAEFMRLINEPIREGEEGGAEVMEQLAQAMAGAGAGGEAGGAPGQIFVTEEEHQQIGRLTELAQTIGLEQSHVLESWLACDRNETLAANYLVDNAEQLRADQAESEANANTNSQNQQDQPDSGNQGPPA